MNSDGWISDQEPNLCFSSALHLNFWFPKFVREMVSFKCFDLNWVVWGCKPSYVLSEAESGTGSGLIQASFLYVPLPSWGETPLGKGKGHKVTWPGCCCSGGSVVTATGPAGLDTFAVDTQTCWLWGLVVLLSSVISFKWLLTHLAIPKLFITECLAVVHLDPL